MMQDMFHLQFHILYTETSTMRFFRHDQRFSLHHDLYPQPLTKQFGNVTADVLEVADFDLYQLRWPKKKLWGVL